LLGALLIHRLPIERIRKFIAFLLVFVGLGIGGHLISTLEII
jgi:uncharacterized membrane protein YfcA